MGKIAAVSRYSLIVLLFDMVFGLHFFNYNGLVVPQLNLYNFW